MNTLLIEFKNTIIESLLGLAWQQWSAIGVPGYSRAEETTVVDPEALLLLTLTVGRYDARLFDEMLTWLEINGNFVNVQRLQNIVKQFDYQAKPELSSVAELLSCKSSVALKWKKLATKHVQNIESPLFFQKDGRPMPVPTECDGTFRKHGLLRPKFEKRGHARPFPREGMAALLLRLRALFGVNLRCEILCLLGSADEVHPSRVARLIGRDPRSTQIVLAEMVHSGVVGVRTCDREKKYALAPDVLDPLLRPGGPTPWVNSVPLFRALEIIWLAVSDPGKQTLDPLMLASEWRRLVRRVLPLLGDAGMGQPFRDDSRFPGERYFEIFMEDISKFLTQLGV